MRRVFPIVALVMLPLLCLSCREPSSVETFIKAGTAAEGGGYHFVVDLSDTTALYDISFFTRLDADANSLSEVESFPIDVQWTSPSGELYGERVFFPLSGGGRQYYSHQYRTLYRMGVSPKESGIWDITLTPGSDVPGLRGLGIVCSKN